tara:strand:+ start:4611 stop:5912 length:1302 start_codon:yes stop_codon:yes gene_type:complete
MIAQENNNEYPVIGEKIPDHFFSDVYYGEKKEFSIREFKGKPLIIDFFSLGCSSCFRSFPEINKLKKEFGDQLEIILVAPNRESTYEKTKEVYEKFRKKYKLDFKVAYDPLIFDKFRIEYVPRTIYIDNNQIVKAVTGDITREKLNKFLNKEEFEFNDYSFDKIKKERKKYNYGEHFLVDNKKKKSDSLIIQRSLLTKWNKSIPFFSASYNNIDKYETIAKNSIPFKMLGFPLEYLYSIAYFGYIDWTPSDQIYGKASHIIIYETPNGKPKLFNNKNKFCYDLKLPNSMSINAKNVMPIMQRDLKNFFNFDITVEERMMPYLKLTVSDKAIKKLKTKGGEKEWSGKFDGILLNNQPVLALIQVIDSYNSLGYKNLPVIDETGIQGNIDIKLNGILTDLDDTKRTLKINGLELVEGKKLMKVIVVRDPKPEPLN